jgi:hypothetical protein
LCDSAFKTAEQLADHLPVSHPKEMRYRNGRMLCWCGEWWACTHYRFHILDVGPLADHFLACSLGENSLGENNVPNDLGR